MTALKFNPLFSISNKTANAIVRIEEVRQLEATIGYRIAERMGTRRISRDYRSFASHTKIRIV